MATRLDYMQQSRLDKLQAWIDQGVDPYPADSQRTHKAMQVLAKDGIKATLAGRIISWRGHGRLQFADLKDESGTIQLAFRSDLLTQQAFDNLKLLDTSDFLEVSGVSFTTKTGQRSLEVHAYRLLSKAIKPLPNSWHGLKDTEERFRKRYVDLQLNPQIKQVLDYRWQIERAIREFLWSQNFYEVETPILQNLYGGTNAKPFTTHLNALDTEMYLRIAPELYLKRLIVGGYERVFEIARNFRNEGMDQTHQPEFTMMEWYEAYADYYRVMDLTEELFKHIANRVFNSLNIEVGEHTIDLSGQWRRLTMDEALMEYCQIDSATITDQEIQQHLSKHRIQIAGVYSRQKGLFSLYDDLVPPHLIQPTWVIDYPADVSPLAKAHRSKPGRVERFEAYIGGKEICDGWSEINSAIEQRSRFENEQANLKAGDDEAQPLDEEFLEALEHGAPPMGGIGIGIDRLVMFFTNTWKIREVIAFPLMRRNVNVQPELLSMSTSSITPTVSTETAKSSSSSLIDYSIAPSVKHTFPDMSYAYVLISGVSIATHNEALETFKQEIITRHTPESVEAISSIPSIAAYRQIFKATGVWGQGRRPSPEAHYRRLVQGKGIYQINTAVDAYNLAVIQTGISLAGFNAQKVIAPITLRFTEAGEEMLLLGDDSPTSTKKGELAYADAQQLLTLDLNYRDLDATKITLDTSEILLIADGAPGIDPQAVLAALELGAQYITRFCGGTSATPVLVQ